MCEILYRPAYFSVYAVAVAGDGLCTTKKPARDFGGKAEVPGGRKII